MTAVVADDIACASCTINTMFGRRSKALKVLLVLVGAWVALTVIGYAGGPGCTAQGAVEIGVELCATGAVLLAGAGLRRAVSTRLSRPARRPVVMALLRARQPVEYLWPAPPGAPRVALSKVLVV